MADGSLTKGYERAVALFVVVQFFHVFLCHDMVQEHVKVRYRKIINISRKFRLHSHVYVPIAEMSRQKGVKANFFSLVLPLMVQKDMKAWYINM